MFIPMHQSRAHPEVLSDSNDSALRHTVRMTRPSVDCAVPSPAEPPPFRPAIGSILEIFNRRYFGN